MKVSVIVPCYQAEEYLEACVASVLAQSMADFELILVDDGSTDATPAILERLAATDVRIRVFSQKNGGVSVARNLGLRHASGDWVSFVDADDLLEARALEAMLSAADEETDMVVAGHETFDEDGHTQRFLPAKSLAADGCRGAVLRLIQGDSVMNIMCAKLHRRAALEGAGVSLRGGVAIAEDALFNLEAALSARKIVFLRESVYRYRMHARSATHTRERGEFASHERWLWEMRRALEARGMLEAFYAEFVESATLRLYKDGGVGNVRRRFSEKAGALTSPKGLDRTKMSFRGSRYASLCEKGTYGAVYPLLWPFQEWRWQMSDRRR